MNTLRIAAFAFAFSACTILQAKSLVPRAATELTVAGPSGKQLKLSSYRGSVVLVQFLYTTCHHCAETAKLYEKMRKEFGARGLKVLGVAFNDGVSARPELIGDFTSQNEVQFPIGASTPQTVLTYLGLSAQTRFVVPQILIVDRKGTIRAQSEPLGSPEFQNEGHLRALLEDLLKER
jgi:peroxiredoxin